MNDPSLENTLHDQDIVAYRYSLRGRLKSSCCFNREMSCVPRPCKSGERCAGLLLFNDTSSRVTVHRPWCWQTNTSHTVQTMKTREATWQRPSITYPPSVFNQLAIGRRLSRNCRTDRQTDSQIHSFTFIPPITDNRVIAESPFANVIAICPLVSLPTRQFISLICIQKRITTPLLPGATIKVANPRADPRVDWPPRTERKKKHIVNINKMDL